MKPHGVMVGIIMGCVCLLFAVVPSLFHGLTEGVQDFLDSASSGLPRGARRRVGSENLQRPIWLAVLGAMLIALSLVGYLSN